MDSRGFLGDRVCAICNFPRENEELQLEQELSRQSDSGIGAT
jgi:hypothetical protein